MSLVSFFIRNGQAFFFLCPTNFPPPLKSSEFGTMLFGFCLTCLPFFRLERLDGAAVPFTYGRTRRLNISSTAISTCPDEMRAR